jgi:probable HAF family extracellular repeat protein
LDLNTQIVANTGWTLVGARGINDSGQIIGYGFINSQVHGFLLTPVPIPPAMWLFGSGLLGLIGVSRCKVV